MLATLVLALHALAALLFGALAAWALRRSRAELPRRTFPAGLALTALWALAFAGLGNAAPAPRILEGTGTLAWLGFLYVLHRRSRSVHDRPAIALVHGSVALAVVLATALALAARPEAVPGFAEAASSAALLLRIMATITMLVLIHGLYAGLRTSGLRTIVLALAAMWLFDLNLLTLLYLSGSGSELMLALRGAVLVAVAAVMGIALQRRGDWTVEVSRAVAVRTLSFAAVALYFLLLVLGTSLIPAVAGGHARMFQTAFVFGATAAALTLASTSWLRAWTKVKLAKHFFRHRYDYRAEWMRFTETLGRPDGAAPLEERIVKAVADLTDSPAGVLLVPDGDSLAVGAAWNWPADDLPTAADEGALARHLEATERIVELDPLRAERGDARDAAATPQWMLDCPRAWALVPLPHLGRLTGAILLARPPLDRALDWEDFDLLKVAGRQVASYLAEARAHGQLTEAQRFDEFNRRFAFILHDIKNLVSQLALVARNAERHADNPEFRADMVATLRDSSDRMNDLLARLSRRHRAPRAEDVRPVEVMPLLDRIAGSRRAQHPIVTAGSADAIALADPALLDQLLGHLVQNAIDASAPNEPVMLAAVAAPERVMIDVVDQGCGMSPRFLREELFKPFASSKPGGFGIGAYEARELAASMGGRIDVTSREGRGSRFRVILPSATAYPAEGDPALGRAA